MKNIFSLRCIAQKGFTLVEMLVVAPVVILFIGGFVAVIVNLTGETLASQASNNLAYNLQDTLNRIEDDIQFSTDFLAVNDIPSSSTLQGYNDNPNTGSTTDFTNVVVSGGSTATLIIKRAATNVAQTSLVFLANSPNNCTDPALYSENTPMSTNIVYFVDANGVLWRRTIMTADFDNPTIRCGDAPLQQPTCVTGYNAALRTNCKTTDIRLLDGVSAATFNFNYFTDANATIANTAAENVASSNAVRDAALDTLTSVEVTISSTDEIAGRTITQSGSIRATRL